MELKDTIQLMESDDYGDRLKAEYHQTKIRYEQLRKTLIKADAGTLNNANMDIGLLRQQANVMGQYLYILEIRAEKQKMEL